MVGLISDPQDNPDITSFEDPNPELQFDMLVFFQRVDQQFLI